MERTQQTTRSAIAALATAFLWASAFPAVKYLLDYYSAESIMLLRFFIASLTLLIVAVVKKVKLPERKDLPLFALGGFVGIFLYAWLFITGTDAVPSGVSSFLIASAPVFTALLSVSILKEKVRLFSWIGMAVSLCGLLIITASQMSGFTMNMGVVLLVGASIATSVYTIVQRRLTKKYTPLEATVYTVCFGTLFMSVFLPGLLREMPGVPLMVNLIPVYLGAFPAAIAYLLWAYALSKARSTAHVTMSLYLIPFLATLFAFLWLNERISPSAFLGGIVIILGMFLSSRWGSA
ncbi:MAG: DMT family transporter [Oscillospiraceae bacterium]|nr:DMT family transporter [Oscillospiraceae bacterium]